MNEYRLNPVIPAPKRRSPKNPPNKDPKMPKIIAPIQPPAARLGEIASAITPTINPNNIHVRMFTNSSHLPSFSFILA